MLRFEDINTENFSYHPYLLHQTHQHLTKHIPSAFFDGFLFLEDFLVQQQTALKQRFSGVWPAVGTVRSSLAGSQCDPGPVTQPW